MAGTMKSYTFKTGGTFITVYEAEMQGKPIKHFWPKRETNETP